MGRFILSYNNSEWEELTPSPVNTLQVFITNKCNLRCKACFYAHNLGKEDMSLEEYKQAVRKYLGNIRKVILLGGEPTLHKDLNKIIAFNTESGLRTTLYTNGTNLKALKKADMSKTKIRIGIYGAELSEKPLEDVPSVKFPVTIVYMLRKDNIKDLPRAMRLAENNFNCQAFYISSIRDIAATQDYWKDTAQTLPLGEYFKVVQKTVTNYKGNINELHIATRGVIKTKNNQNPVSKCRFGNVFPDGKKITCPLDISKKVYTKELRFNERKCNKHHECILQKIVLRKIT